MGDVLGKGGGGGDMNFPAQDRMVEMAEQMFSETAPIREGFLSDFEALMAGDIDLAKGTRTREVPSSFFGGDSTTTVTEPDTGPLSGAFRQTFSQAKEGIEDQYGVARENILSSLPRGGGMERGISELETSRAETSAALPAQISQNIINDMMNKAYGVAFNTPGQAMQGIGSAASSMAGLQGQQMAAQAAETGAKYQGMGTAAGMAAAMKYCWVAVALFGESHIKTGRARFYCHTHNNWFTRLYKKHGQKWAQELRGSHLLRLIASPIWNYLSYRGNIKYKLLLGGMGG